MVEPLIVACCPVRSIIDVVAREVIRRMGSNSDSTPPAVMSSRRRQWGTELPRPPLPAVEPAASDLRMWMGGLAIFVTIAGWITYMVSTVMTQFIDNGIESTKFLVATAFYVLVMTLLTFSALMYLLARQGAMYRSRQHHRVPRADIDAHFAGSTDSITVLVPSYREDAALITGTLISAALQEFPLIRVVLLIDDPPNPASEEHRRALETCRALPGELSEWLRHPQERFVAAAQAHDAYVTSASATDAADGQVADLAGHFRWAAEWLTAESIGYSRTSTAECFLADEVLGALALDFAETADALDAARHQHAVVPLDRVGQLYQRLVWTFQVEFDSFERKQYASLSNEVNKAMNLNSYIGLMGREFAQVQTPAGVVLEVVEDGGDVVIPSPDYVLTLDADSILLREYCMRLVYLMEQPGNERMAIAQTPYSAFRGARTRLERMAGGTTDIQHLVHQGLTYYNATFWVGANAVIRKEALDELVEISFESGREIRRYVQDRTVIEDTESSIDLISHGWSLYNYPERLSYSATPPDFGALVVQRGRWANGGLLIIPKYWRYRRAMRRAGTPVRLTESMLRINYMGSIFWGSFSLVFLLAFPFTSALLSPVIFVAALPYFLAMASDFRRMGYKRSDVLRAYGFNLILLPVNLAGVLKSLQQAASKSKTPFARTPKVRNRTAAPALYIIAILVILGFSAFTLQQDIIHRNVMNGVFAAVNTLLTTYALIAFVGLGNAVVDIALGFWHWLRVPVKSAVDAEAPSEVDWQAVLYFGPGESMRRTDTSALPRHLPVAPLPPVTQLFPSSETSERNQASSGAETSTAGDAQVRGRAVGE